jgi:hypothetical protein
VRRPTADVLPKVAQIYRAALASDDEFEREAPTAAVAKRLNYSRGHASRLVSAARKQGLLGEARRGRSGEILTQTGDP